MSYKQIRCGKCGIEVSGKHAVAVKNPDGPGACGLLVDVCDSCNASKDLQKTLQDRLYPKDSVNEQVVIARNEEKDRAARYQKSKEEWIAANPNCAFPDGHS